MPENVKHHMDIIKRTSDANPDHVRMTGYIPDSEMDTYISASDIIMFPHIIYAASSISGAVHRVIDSGKPILASTFPLYDDLINGVSCLKLPENLNLYSMPTLISEVLHDDKLMSHIGNGAKKLAEDTSWKVVAEMTEVVYRKVVERAGGNF
jgi:glycosyltransferase involved in cell wall biosynthesis